MYVLHRKGDTFTPEIHIEDRHGDLLMYLHHIGRIFHVPVGKLAYMNEAVLVYAYIHKNTKGRYIRNYARELHPRLHILHSSLPRPQTERSQTVSGGHAPVWTARP